MARRVEFTIADSATDSDWINAENASGPQLTKLGALYTPTGTPSTTISVAVRDANNPAVEYPVKDSGGSALSITVNGLGAYGADVLAPLSSLVEGKQWQLTLGTANTSGSAIKLILEFS